MSINILHNFVHRISDFCIRYLHKTLENWLEMVDMCISRLGYQFHKEILCLPISRHWWTLNHIFFLIILVENKPSSVKTMINTNCKFQQQCQENVVTTQLRVDKAKKSQILFSTECWASFPSLLPTLLHINRHSTFVLLYMAYMYIKIWTSTDEQTPNIQSKSFIDIMEADIL